MSAFLELRYWSPSRDTEVARLSMAGSHGEEYWVEIAVDAPGRVYREARDRALDAIEDAIARKAPAGEVKHAEL